MISASLFSDPKSVSWKDALGLATCVLLGGLVTLGTLDLLETFGVNRDTMEWVPVVVMPLAIAGFSMALFRLRYPNKIE